MQLAFYVKSINIKMNLLILLKDISLAMASISTETSLVLVLACFALVLMGGLSYKYNEHKWNNKCPRCAEKGEEVYVLPGKHCPRCNQPC